MNKFILLLAIISTNCKGRINSKPSASNNSALNQLKPVSEKTLEEIKEAYAKYSEDYVSKNVTVDGAVQIIKPV